LHIPQNIVQICFFCIEMAIFKLQIGSWFLFV